MKIRVVAAAALALALGAGLSGCNLISPQRTTTPYAASDGVQVNLNGVNVRNALLIVDSDSETNSEANLVFTAALVGGSDATIDATVNGGGTVSIPLTTAEGSQLAKVGFGEAGPQIVTGEFRSGDTVDVTFTAKFTNTQGEAVTEEATIKVPILGASDPANVLLEYQTLAPGANATATTLPTSTN